MGLPGPARRFVLAEEKPFSCLVVSKRTGTGKLCFRSNIGEQSRRLEVVANSFWLGVFGRQGMRLRCASAAPCRCANHHPRHTLPATRNNLGALEIRGRDFVEAKMPPSHRTLSSEGPWPLSEHAKERTLERSWRTGHAGRTHVHAGSEGRRPRRRGHGGCADWQGEDGVRRPRAEAVTVDCIRSNSSAWVMPSALAPHGQRASTLMRHSIQMILG